VIKDFIFVFGDLPITEINREKAVSFREALCKLPTKRHVRPKYKDRSYSELMGMNIDGEHLQSDESVSQKLGTIRTYFAWLVETERLEKNPFKKVTIASKKKSYSEYSLADLNTIFSSELYQPESDYAQLPTTSASMYWLPLLALFTGARPSELMQMRLDDIKEIDGVLAASVVDDESKGQRTKTAAGKRTFPIHHTLLELGFVEFLDAVRSSGGERVLTGIGLGKEKAGAGAGTWWNERYRAKRLPKDFKIDKKVLYSFRHTHITEALSVAQIPLQWVQQMVGHERSQMGATRYYDKGLAVPALSEEIRKIKYSGLDLSGLRGQWKMFRRL